MIVGTENGRVRLINEVDRLSFSVGLWEYYISSIYYTLHVVDVEDVGIARRKSFTQEDTAWKHRCRRANLEFMRLEGRLHPIALDTKVDTSSKYIHQRILALDR